MTLLFSSDFHGRESVFQSFADALARGPYAAGLLAGDLMEEWLPPETVEQHGSLGEALAAQQRRLAAVLEAAGKPIYFVLGNHDVTPWPDTALLTNLHGRSVTFQGYRLAGYRWTRMDRYPDELEADVPELTALVDDTTLLLSHSPPAGTLDGIPGSRFRYGLKSLARLSPWWRLFGHVHECPGVEGRAVNGAWPTFQRFWSVDPEAGAEPVTPR